jgi:lysophospholipase L1-like esterase
MRRSLACGVSFAIVVISINYKNARDLAAYAASRFVNLEKARLSHSEYVAVRERYVQENQSEKKPVILFLGDSLTFGFRPVRSGFTNALNRAIEGDTTLGILSRLDDNVANLELDCVFLMIGYNDLKFRNNERILKNLDEIVGRLRTDRIVVQSVLPIDPRRRWFNKRIVSLNAMIWAQYRNSNRVKLLDLYPQFKDPKRLGIQQILTCDGVHLTEEGYRRWADCLQKYHQVNLK